MADGHRDAGPPPRVAIVVGAARGIGAAVSRALREDGAAVVAVDKDSEVVHLDDAVTVHGDATDDASLEEAFTAAARLPGTLHSLVYLPALQQSEPVLDLSRQTWDRTLDVTLTGAWRWAQRFGTEANMGGSIVLVSSVHAVRHSADLVAYGTAKAALSGLAECLAVGLGPRGIRTNAVLPGFIAVDRNRWRWDDPEQAATLTASNPLGRLGRPEDVAGVVAFLSSDRAGFVNGTCIPVDGGSLVSH